MSQQPSSANQAQNKAANKKVPPNVRVMIGIVASPTLLVIAFCVYSLVYGNWQDPGFGGILFSLLGLFAYYLVIVGRLPRWFNFK